MDVTASRLQGFVSPDNYGPVVTRSFRVSTAWCEKNVNKLAWETVGKSGRYKRGWMIVCQLWVDDLGDGTTAVDVEMRQSRSWVYCTDGTRFRRPRGNISIRGIMRKLTMAERKCPALG